MLIGDDYQPEGQAEGVPLTEQSIKSALALPWPARLPAGRHVISGFAHSPNPISEVEWSTDSGSTWKKADFHVARERYSWTRFKFAWSPSPGDYTVMTRATDAAGSTQPDTVPFQRERIPFQPAAAAPDQRDLTQPLRLTLAPTGEASHRWQL